MKRVTYGAIASKLTGVLDANNIIARNVKNYLTPIQYFCLYLGFPNITSIVVIQGEIEPSKGCRLVLGKNYEEEQNLVLKFDWLGIDKVLIEKYLTDEEQKTLQVLILIVKK